jgi:hypothetical protein
MSVSEVADALDVSPTTILAIFAARHSSHSVGSNSKIKLRQLSDFLLELGDDFAFLGRQRRLRIDDTWFRIDLVFFHRRLRCLLIIDLLCGRPHKRSSVAQPVMWRSAKQAAIFTPFQYLNAT